MKTVITAAALLLCPALAFAAPLAGGHAPDPAKLERMEKRMQVARTIGLANALDLDAGGAMQLNAAMNPFDDKRKAVHEQLKASKEILEKAADGDPAAAGQVDQAIRQAFDARSQLEQIDRDMLATVSKNLSPQQKAKLSLFLARFKKEMMERMGKHEGHGHEMKGQFQVQ